MKYVVEWHIQGNSMHDPSEHASRTIEADGLLDLHDQLQDSERFPLWWGSPARIYEAPKMIDLDEFEAIYLKAMMEKAKGK